MPAHLPRLHNLAKAVFERCARADQRGDIRHDFNNREIRLHDFGDDNSDFGWVIHRHEDGSFVALHIESFCDLAHDYLIGSLSDDQQSERSASALS